MQGISLLPWAPAFLAMTSIPDVDVARPSACPHCHHVARDGGKIWLWGHGPRERLVLVLPLLPFAHRLVECWSRRYACQSCGRACTVLPTGLLSRLLYSLWSIVAAWLLVTPGPVGAGLSERDAYRRQGLYHHADWTAATRYRWRSLERWRRLLPRRVSGLEEGVPARLLTSVLRARDGTLESRVVVAVAQLRCGPRAG